MNSDKSINLQHYYSFILKNTILTRVFVHIIFCTNFIDSPSGFTKLSFIPSYLIIFNFLHFYVNIGELAKFYHFSSKWRFSFFMSI